MSAVVDFEQKNIDRLELIQLVVAKRPTYGSLANVLHFFKHKRDDRHIT